MRRTHIDIEDESAHEVEDIWTESGEMELSHPWVGKTFFDLLHPPAPPGWERQNGRLTKIQKTTRPENVWVEVWRNMVESDKKEAIAKWKVFKTFAWCRQDPKRDLRDTSGRARALPEIHVRGSRKVGSAEIPCDAFIGPHRGCTFTWQGCQA